MAVLILTTAPLPYQPPPTPTAVLPRDARVHATRVVQTKVRGRGRGRGRGRVIGVGLGVGVGVRVHATRVVQRADGTHVRATYYLLLTTYYPPLTTHYLLLTTKG